MTDTERTPEQEAAIEASKPGVFSLIERLQQRNMPSEVVTIYLDEDAAYHRQLLLEERAVTVDAERLREIDEQLDELTKRIKDTAVEIHMTAVSSERYDELLKEAEEAFPVKHDIVTNPMTGRKTKEQRPSPERYEYFNRIYLAEVVRKAVMGSDVDEDITPNWIQSFEKFAPLDALRRVVAKAFSLRMTAEWMEAIQNEDFSQKP